MHKKALVGDDKDKGGDNDAGNYMKKQKEKKQNKGKGNL